MSELPFPVPPGIDPQTGMRRGLDLDPLAATGDPSVTGPDGRRFTAVRPPPCAECGLYHGAEVAHHRHTQPDPFTACACGHLEPLRFTLGDAPTHRVMLSIAAGDYRPAWLRRHRSGCEQRAIAVAPKKKRRRGR